MALGFLSSSSSSSSVSLITASWLVLDPVLPLLLNCVSYLNTTSAATTEVRSSIVIYSSILIPLSIISLLYLSAISKNSLTVSIPTRCSFHNTAFTHFSFSLIHFSSATFCTITSIVGPLSSSTSFEISCIIFNICPLVIPSGSVL